METKNVINKINILDIIKKNRKYLYLFMSFIFSNDANKKTLDLVFNNESESSARKWFYGLHYYFFISKRPYKICSCTNYILFRIKCKIFKKLNLDMNEMKKKKFSLAKCIMKYFNTFNNFD